MADETKTVSQLIADLSNSNWNIRLSAVVDLSRVRRSSDELPTVIAALIGALQDPNEFVPREAAMALGNFGHDAAGAVPKLAALLKSSDELLRQSIVYTLGKIGTDSKSTIPDLMALFDDPADKVKTAIAWALSMVARESLGLVIDGLGSNKVSWRIGCAQALGKMGPPALPAAPDLIRTLNDDVPEVRYAAARSLGALRDVAPAVQPLIELLKDKDVDVRWAAAEALMKIGTPEALAAWGTYEPRSSVNDLIKQLKNPNRLVRENSAKALKDQGKAAKEAIRPLIEALKDQMSPKVRMLAAEALGRIGPEAEEAVLPLIKLLDSKEENPVRKAASQALGRIGPEAAEAFPKLKELLSSPEKDVSNAAAMALQRIATPDALALIKDYRWE